LPVLPSASLTGTSRTSSTVDGPAGLAQQDIDQVDAGLGLVEGQRVGGDALGADGGDRSRSASRCWRRASISRADGASSASRACSSAALACAARSASVEGDDVVAELLLALAELGLGGGQVLGELL
jgi:hypothetical protein